MFPAVLSICWLLLLQFPLKTTSLQHDFGLQDGIVKHGVVATYVQPQQQTIFEPQTNYDSVSLLNNLLGIRDENKVQSNLETLIDWLKKLVSTATPPIKQQDSRLKGVSLTQFAKLLQRNDDPLQKLEFTLHNSQAYLSMIQKLLIRLDKNIPAINKSNIYGEKSWNNKILAQFIDKMLDEGTDDHTIIQSLRLLLRSMDNNMENLDKRYHLAQQNNGEETKVIGAHSIILQQKVN